MSELGSAIKAARAAAGLSQRALAAAAGVTQKTVSDIEGGRSEPHSSTARKIAEALGVPVAVLFGHSKEHDRPLVMRTWFLPIYGTVPAGPPQQGGEILGSFPVLLHQWGENRYVLRVWGDSMYPVLRPDDLILVEYTEDLDPEACQGKTCVCLYQGESTLKTVELHGIGKHRSIVLRPANPRAKAIEVERPEDLQIQGRVISLVQRLL